MQRIFPFILACAASIGPTGASTTIQDEPEARISAQFLKPDGTPATGAKWSVHGWQRNTDVVRQHGLPDDWNDLKGTLDDEGRIDLRFVSPQAYQFVFSVRADGFAEVSWRFGSIKPEEEKLLGTIELEPECLIKGRIVGPDGAVLSDRAWSIRAREDVRAGFGARDAAQTIIRVKPGEKSFVVKGLPPGKVEFNLSPVGQRTSKKFELNLVAGKPLERDFLFDAESLVSPHITIYMTARPFIDYRGPSDEHIKVVAADGTEVPVSRRHPSFPQLEATPDVDGPFTVTVDDLRFEPFEQKNVAKGDRVRVRLVGTASLKLDVRDPSGEPVSRFQLTLATPNALNPPAQLLDGESAPEDGVVRNVVPGVYGMTVRTAEAVARIDLPQLEAKEQREVTVQLEPLVLARGLVLYPDGEPVTGAEVLLIKPAAEGDAPDSRILFGRSSSPIPQFRTIAGRGQSDSDGTYSIEIPEPGQYLLIARETGKTRVVTEIFESGEEGVTRDLELPRGALLKGFVALPEFMSDEDWEVYIGRENFHQELDALFEAPRLDSRGEFRFVGLPAGDVSVYLRSPRNGIGFSDVGKPRGSYFVGAITLKEGGVHKATFALEDGLPSRVTIKLTSTELLGETAKVYFKPTGARSSSSNVTFQGPIDSLSPKIVAPGTYEVSVQGDGWAAMHLDPVTVESGEDIEIPVGVETKECTVQIFVGGKPATGRSVRFWSGTWRGLTVKCDDEGFVTARIDTGPLQVQVVPKRVAGVMPRPESLDVAWPVETESLHFDE